MLLMWFLPSARPYSPLVFEFWRIFGAARPIGVHMTGLSAGFRHTSCADPQLFGPLGSERRQDVVHGRRGGLGEAGPLDRDALGLVANLAQAGT
jgi:hypothetical protein